MLDLHEGVAELFEEAERAHERAFEAENFVWRMMYRVGRWSGVVIPPLPFPMSCRFCRRGVHSMPHFAGCPFAPPWARQNYGAVKPKPRVVRRRPKPKQERQPVEQLPVAPFPMSCRFCRRGIHHDNHVTACGAYRLARAREARLACLRERRRDREVFAA